MHEFIGLNVIRIHAPQDRHAIELYVINEENQIGVVRFANDDGTPIEIEFSDLNIRLHSDPDSNQIDLGEFEHLNEIEGGYEVVGDFGIFWVKCKKYTYHVRSS
jgi:hypothetical protein